MADEHVPRKPDAVRCPRDFPMNRNDPGRDSMRNKVFGPLLGVPRVNNVELIDRQGESFVRKSIHDSLLYPTGHPKEKQDRYAWFIAVRQPDGSFTPGLPELGDPSEAGKVKLGYLLVDEHADDPSVAAAVQASYDERLAAAMTDPAHLARMRELGVLPPEAQPDNPKAAPLPTGPDPATRPAPLPPGPDAMAKPISLPKA
jgi:hypothetical protein